ncbi:hypothetical protein PY092_19610 [Muricauda sp. 334s03]|uniref:Restriction endonuclease n=1 Tax=Flagellimonas yonaguniensis TaxID=3031325 RepID=A0ABT5Y4X1_9FLAO|nr:hypothetical protein [[Muricauda] yonaguniensis]MDF0718371.1 hypothetical protein [[Muricauda] yonaguniensis]
MDSKKLYEIIYETVLEEDNELTNLTGKGIFYAPELYVAFILGKSIKKNEISIFNKEVSWVRETNLGNTGPTDFAFEVDEATFAFELKLRDNIGNAGHSIPPSPDQSEHSWPVKVSHPRRTKVSHFWT